MFRLTPPTSAPRQRIGHSTGRRRVERGNRTGGDQERAGNEKFEHRSPLLRSLGRAGAAVARAGPHRGGRDRREGGEALVGSRVPCASYRYLPSHALRREGGATGYSEDGTENITHSGRPPELSGHRRSAVLVFDLFYNPRVEIVDERGPLE